MDTREVEDEEEDLMERNVSFTTLNKRRRERKRKETKEKVRFLRNNKEDEEVGEKKLTKV